MAVHSELAPLEIINVQNCLLIKPLSREQCKLLNFKQKIKVMDS